MASPYQNPQMVVAGWTDKIGPQRWLVKSKSCQHTKEQPNTQIIAVFHQVGKPFLIPPDAQNIPDVPGSEPGQADQARPDISGTSLRSR
jgi:hypothetical protein